MAAAPGVAQRARGSRQGRRGASTPPDEVVPRPRRRRRRAVADGRAAGRRDVRLAGPRRARAHRPRRPRPACRAARPPRRAARAGGRSSSTATRWPTPWSRCATRRSGRWPTHRRCARSRCADRLRELDFELPLAGGDLSRGPATDVTLGDLAPLLRRHLPRATRCAATPTRSATPARRPDAARLPHRLGRRGAAAARARATWSSTTRPTGSARATSRSPRDAYRPEALAEAMGHSDYPLQALLYAAVLHRFLRWRQPGYDPERAPRRRALPLPARHVRPRHPARRRRAVRGLRLAAAGGAGRGAVRPARRGGDRMTELFEPTGDARPAAGPRGRRPAGRVQRAPGCSPRPTSTWPTGSATSAGGRDERVLLAVGAGGARACATARSASTWPRSPTIAPDLPWPDAPAWADGGRARPRWPRRAWCARSTTWLYLDRYHRLERQVCDDLLARAAAAAARRSTRPRLEAALARVRGRRTSAPSSERAAAAVRPPAAGPRCSPAVPAPARPPRSRGCWSLLADQAERRTGGSRSRSAAPTGKAAARLQEAVDRARRARQACRRRTAAAGRPPGRR